jgi:hypothetical protein
LLQSILMGKTDPRRAGHQRSRNLIPLDAPGIKVASPVFGFSDAARPGCCWRTSVPKGKHSARRGQG